MTDDKRTEEKLDRLLGGAPAPPADEARKKRDIRMAVDAFRAGGDDKAGESDDSSQGIWGLFRPTGNNDTNGRRTVMAFRKRLLITGLSTVCAGLVGVAVFLQVFDITGIDYAAEVVDPDAETDYHFEDRVAKRMEPGTPPAPDDGQAPAVVSRSAEAPARQQAMEEAAVQGIRADRGAAADRRLMKPAPDQPPAEHYKDAGRDEFERVETNTFQRVAEAPVSTFSVDVDTASYSFVRRRLNNGVLPQKDAVRVEEMINYFDYSYPLPDDRREPFKPFVAVTESPWAEGRRLMHIGVKGYDIAPADKPRSNLVFLLDTSGSMNSPDKLPLVKQSMEMLLSSLDPNDTVAIAVYAGAAGTVLEPTEVKNKQAIRDALDQLKAGGSTAGAEGIRLAYQLAESNIEEDAINRVILATDGDFNVGITDRDELQDFVERKRDKGIYLSVLGFGQGNYNDHLMQTLAQNGNGVAAYIDTLGEAQKVLVDEAASALFPIARDAKIQVEFNPAAVAEYRLIGYETRHLNREDFNNDAVDAGDIGAGHTVTALYEIVPVGSDARMIDDSRYEQPAEAAAGDGRADEYAFVKIRYKLPDEDESRLITRPVGAADDLTVADNDFDPWVRRDTAFAAAVAGFAQLLKGGRYTGDLDYDDVIGQALAARGEDEYGYRTEFVQLVRKAKTADAMKTD